MEPLKIYHIYNHANGFENLFKSEENYRFFLRRYEHFIPAVADTLAYCLMPNHIHFLIRIKSEEDIVRNLEGFKNRGSSFRKSETFGKIEAETFGKIESRVSKQFGNLFSSYTQAFNKMYGRMGSLFIPNFKRKEITDNSYFTNIIHYIHANPVHHCFTPTIADWKWSSYGDIIEEMSSIVKHEEIIQWFGNKGEFIKFHQQPIDVRTKMEMER